MRRRAFITGAAALLVPAAADAATIITSGAASARALGFGHKTASSTSALNPADKAAGITLSNANFTATNNNGSTSNVRGTLSHNTGKWHFEATVNSSPGGTIGIGIGDATASLTTLTGTDLHSIAYRATGAVVFNNTQVGSGDSFTTGSVIAVEVDMTNTNFYVQKSGGTGRMGPFSFAGMGASVFVMFDIVSNTGALTLNTGGSPFSISPTAGFSAWG